MTIASCSHGKEELYYFDVEGTGFKVSSRLFRNRPSVLANLTKSAKSPTAASRYKSHFGRGSIQRPFFLRGHSADQFTVFLHALTLNLNALPHPLELVLEDLISLAELSHRYDAPDLLSWSINGLTPAIMLAARDPSQSDVLSTEFFIRVLQIALLSHDSRLANMAQSVWTDRIHRSELPAAPAITFADEHNLLLLQIHAYYAELLLVAPSITAYGVIPDEVYPDLDASQRTHLVEGYHSLRAFWAHLQDNPPIIEQASDCPKAEHFTCVSAWNHRWLAMVNYPMKCEEVDVLRRFTFIGKSLETDRTLQLCMRPGCRDAAFKMLKHKLNKIGENLWHHFDL